MNRYMMAGCFVALHVLAGGVAQAQSRAGACFYGDADYKGSSFCVNAGEAARQLPRGTERQISSIQVFGDVSVIVYTDPDLQGGSQQFNASVSNLARTNWNDRVASIRVVGGRNNRGGRGDDTWNNGNWNNGVSARVPSNGACFYQDANYRGQYFCTESGGRMTQVPQGAQISSIRVFGDAQVLAYQERGMRGGYREFDSSVNNLDPIGWNDVIASVRVESRYNSGAYNNQDRYGQDRYNQGRNNQNWNWGRPATPSSGACFYQDADYQGPYFCTRDGNAEAALPADVSSQISSIRIFGGAQVTLYRQQDFRGQSRTVTSDVRNLDGTGWNDRIESFRISSRGFSNGDWRRGEPEWR